jgi:hypothetical protein
MENASLGKERIVSAPDSIALSILARLVEIKLTSVRIEHGMWMRRMVHDSTAGHIPPLPRDAIGHQNITDSVRILPSLSGKIVRARRVDRNPAAIPTDIKVHIPITLANQALPTAIHKRLINSPRPAWTFTISDNEHGAVVETPAFVTGEENPIRFLGHLVEIAFTFRRVSRMPAPDAIHYLGAVALMAEADPCGIKRAEVKMIHHPGLFTEDAVFLTLHVDEQSGKAVGRVEAANDLLPIGTDSRHGMKPLTVIGRVNYVHHFRAIEIAEPKLVVRDRAEQWRRARDVRPEQLFGLILQVEAAKLAALSTRFKSPQTGFFCAIFAQDERATLVGESVTVRVGQVEVFVETANEIRHRTQSDSMIQAIARQQWIQLQRLARSTDERSPGVPALMEKSEVVAGSYIALSRGAFGGMLVHLFPIRLNLDERATETDPGLLNGIDSA